MTEDFKKGLATGLAVGGVTIVKGGSGQHIWLGNYIKDESKVAHNGSIMNVPTILIGNVNVNAPIKSIKEEMQW